MKGETETDRRQSEEEMILLQGPVLLDRADQRNPAPRSFYIKNRTFI